jgi:Xaa-Pro dipeptidase
MSSFDHELVTDLEFDALFIQPVKKEERHFEKAPPEAHRYPAKLHAKRVAKFLNASEGIIYLRGTRSETYADSDQSKPHRQSRYFYYITGVDEPDFEATYDIVADRLVLWIPPPRSPRDALYNGDVPSIKDCLRRYDIDDARYAPELPAYVANRGTTIFALHASELPAALPAPGLTFPGLWFGSPTHSLCLSGILSQNYYANAHSQDGVSFFMGGNISQSTTTAPPPPPKTSAVPAIDTTSLLPAIDAARIVKTPYEIAMIRRACAVSSRAHRAVAAQFRQMYTEGNVEATFAATCTNLGARTQAYPIIAGSGPNAARLHYEDNAAPLLDKTFVVLDAGCEWKCYASDVTRTLPIGGKWRSAEAKAIHDLVAEMQDAVLDMMRPGAHWLDFVDKVHDIGLLGLHKLGLLKGDLFEIMTKGRAVMSAFLPHGLGHPVGLEVHDFPIAYYKKAATAQSSGKRTRVPPEVSFSDPEACSHRSIHAQSDPNAPDVPDDNLFDRSAWLLMREGMVLAVEPGLYFNRDYLEAFLASQKGGLARFVDRAVLERFWGVGGCRIEDVVLITETGSEVLSAGAPKGKELWDVINRGS